MELGPYRPLYAPPPWFSIGADDGIQPPAYVQAILEEPSAAKAGTKFATVFVIGTMCTFAVAGFLLLARRPLAAGAVIIASPFPCPPGMPC
jgi:hypothetical protein